MKDATIKDQQETIERLQKELKEKSEMIFRLIELIDKKDKLLNDFVKYIDDRNKKEIEKINQFNDPYFKGLTIEQIFELAKKSIRITTYNRELEKKIEDIREIACNTIEYFYDNLESSNLDNIKEIYKMCDEVVNKEG